MDNVLFINDNKFYIKALSNKLVNDNFYVSGFESLNEASDFLNNYKKDLNIILIGDKSSNNLDSYFIAKNLREKYGLKIPIILLTENIKQFNFKKARVNGINHVLNSEVINNHEILIEYMDILKKLYEKKKRKTVLIIDDSKKAREKLTFEIKGSYFNVITAESGVLGLEKAKKSKPDFIILDVELPGLNGFDICEKIKEDPTAINIPVIYYISNNNVNYKLKGIKAGGVEFFQKDSEPGELIRLLSKIEAYIESDNRYKGIYLGHNSMEYYVLSYFLNKLGIELKNFTNYDKAFKSLENNKFDVIIQDIDFTKNKKKIMELYRVIEDKDHIKKLLIAGSKKDNLFYYLINNAVDDYIFKPYIEEEIRLKISKILRSYENIYKLQSQQEMLNMLSIVDEITQTYKKNYLEQVLESYISRYDREGIKFSVITLKINKFKYIKENYGKKKSEAVLKTVAKTLENLVRPTDMIFRYNQNKYVVLLEGTDKNSTTIVRKRIMKNIGNIVLKNKKELYHKVEVTLDQVVYSESGKEKFINKINDKFK